MKCMHKHSLKIMGTSEPKYQHRTEKVNGLCLADQTTNFKLYYNLKSL